MITLGFGAAGTDHARPPSEQRLFEREADNQHEEPLAVSHIAARTLRRLLQGPQDASSSGRAALCAAVRPWLQQCMQVWSKSLSNEEWTSQQQTHL